MSKLLSFLVPILIILLIIFGLFIIFGIKFSREELDEDEENTNDFNNDNQDFNKEELFVSVVDVLCSAKLVGHKNVKAINEFVIVFEADYNRKIQVSVLEEQYDGFEIGQKGILTLVDGEFYSFELK